MDTQLLSPQDVATKLSVSPSTLRRWSDEFAEFLSDEAGSINGKSGRLYAEEDIGRLLTVKSAMDEGMTYEQVRTKFREKTEFPATSAMMANEDAAKAVVGYISETVESIRQGQKSVLNSQAANRELMGVVIQDNFNLKDENNRLRERMLDLERSVGEVRREEMTRREILRQEIELKLMDLRRMINHNQPQLPAPASLPELEDRPGCWAALFRRNQPAIEIEDEAFIPRNGYAPPPPSMTTPNIPRPPGPPE